MADTLPEYDSDATVLVDSCVGGTITHGGLLGTVETVI